MEQRADAIQGETGDEPKEGKIEIVDTNDSHTPISQDDSHVACEQPTLSPSSITESSETDIQNDHSPSISTDDSEMVEKNEEDISPVQLDSTATVMLDPKFSSSSSSSSSSSPSPASVEEKKGKLVLEKLQRINEQMNQNPTKKASAAPVKNTAVVSETRNKWKQIESGTSAHTHTPSASTTPNSSLNVQSLLSATSPVSEDDWTSIEASIMSSTASTVRKKWKDIEEKGTGTVFESKPRIVPGKLQNIFTLSRSVEEDEKEPEGSAPAPSKGNVFQFLQQKQRQVRDEQEEERIAERQRKELLYKDLPPPPLLPTPPPPVPTTTTSTTNTPSSSALTRSASETNSKKVKKDLKEEKKRLEKEKKEREKKEKKDKKVDPKLKRNSIETSTTPTSAPTAPATTHPRRNSSEDARLANRNSMENSVSPLASTNRKPFTILADFPPPSHLWPHTDKRFIHVPQDKIVQLLDKDTSQDWCEVEYEGQRGLIPRAFIVIPTSTEAAGTLLHPLLPPSLSRSPSNASSSGSLSSFVSPSPSPSPSPTPTPHIQDDEESWDNPNLNPRMYKLEEEDTEANIVFKPTEPGQVRGATIEKLVQKLTHEQFPDPEFWQAFLMTYSAFTTPLELVQLLELRYKTPCPRNMDVATFKKTKQLPIRLRVVNFLKAWIKRDFKDFKDNEAVVTALRRLVTGVIARGMPNAAKEIAAYMEEKAMGEKVIVHSQKPPPPILPKHLLKVEGGPALSSISLSDLAPEEVARQLTLMEHDLFRRIPAKECLRQKWVKPDKKDLAPNIHAMIEQFNRVSMWAATEIVQQEDLKLRAVTLSRFLFIAQKCLELNNFNAVMEILSAVNCSAVHRLKQTWALLPAKSMDLYHNFTRLMDSEGNFSVYREAFRQAVPPSLPYLGLILTDLMFLEENQDKLPNTNLINFAKLSLMGNVIGDFQTVAETPYNLQKVDWLQDYLQRAPYIDNQQELYELSLKREQRVARKKTTATNEK